MQVDTRIFLINTLELKNPITQFGPIKPNLLLEKKYDN